VIIDEHCRIRYVNEAMQMLSGPRECWASSFVACCLTPSARTTTT
jgi:hypothetical protein